MSDSISPPTQPDSHGNEIGNVFRLVSKEWVLVISVMAAVVIGTAFYVLRQTPIYSAELSLKIEPNPIRPLGRDVQTPGETNNSYWSNREYYATQYRLLESRTLAEDVVRSLRLHKSLTFLSSLPSNAKPPQGAQPASVEKAAQIILAHLDVTPIKNSRLVELRYEDADPQRAQQIVRAIAQAYIDRNLDDSVTSIGNAAEWLNNQLSRLKEELERTELALHEYKKENRLLSVTLDDRSNMLGHEMSQLNDALTAARAAREKLASRVTQLNRVTATDPSDLPAGELLSSPSLQNLRATFVTARATHARMQSGGLGENHPEARKALSDSENARAALIAEVQNIQESARRDLAAVDQEIGGLARLFESAEQEAFKLNLLEIEYRRLARARENTERMHGIVLERSKDSELSQQMKFNNIAVVDAPLLPKSPIKPRVGLTIALGAIAGTVLGVLLALLRLRLDIRIREPNHIEESLGLTCLATIPAVSHDAESASLPPLASRRRKKASAAHGPGDEASPELWVHHQPRSTVAEAVRTLRTNLMFMAPDAPHKCFLVTSAGPTDGKTTIASSLAITMAQSGMRVLLLDGDLRRPRLSSVLGAGNSKQGLTTVLLQPSTLSDSIVATQVDGLFLLPSGPLPPNPSELLHSENFRKVLADANGKFDRVIIDSPPLMPVTDAAILSRLVDTTMLVVRSGKTRKDHARQAVRALRDVKADIAGVVLNGHASQKGDGAYYLQYYGYAAREPGLNP